MPEFAIWSKCNRPPFWWAVGLVNIEVQFKLKVDHKIGIGRNRRLVLRLQKFSATMLAFCFQYYLYIFLCLSNCIVK